nr:V-type ATP synthase subunit F [Sedimentibacter sp.]
MKSFLISDNRDTWVGMKLAGINGIIVHDKDNALIAIKNAMKNDEIGIIILTEKVVDMATDEIMEYKLKSKKPLIIEIPDRHGSIRGYDAITNYIRDSVGIKI